jgi:hypothetical protein
MIILEKTKQVQFQGNFDTIKVGIDEKNISHFFRMIANLYQDPVMAVLREIGANCVDAIKEAKTEKMGWQLHLPSRMDGNVRFVDNGVGISHDQMIRIYSIIGASSKRNDNNLIGGFGVGKWSLCSLVNNFQAVSRFNGTKSTYFICLQSNGLPDIKVIKQEQTNERNGFEVKFMCPDKYVAQFNEKLTKAYRFFSIKPNVFIDGVAKSMQYGTEEILFSSKDTGIDVLKDHGDAVVEMGGVGYRLPRESLLENKGFQKFNALINTHLVIHAPIGEYSITPSREAIQLDDITTTRLLAKFNSFIESFIPSLQADMDKFTGNTWQAKKRMRELRDNFKFLPDKINLNWNGKPLTTSNIEVKTAKVKSLSVQTYYKKINSEDEVKTLVVNDNAHLFLDDLGTGGIGRCKFFLETFKKTQSRYMSGVVYVVKKSEKDKFIQETGWVGEFQKTSDLPVPPKQQNVKIGSTSVCAGTLRMRSNNGWGVHECIAPIDINSDRIKNAEQFILFPTFANKIADDSVKITDDFITFAFNHSGKMTSALFLTKKEYDDFNEKEFDGKPIIKIENVFDNAFCDAIKKLHSKIRFDDFESHARHIDGWTYNAKSYVSTIRAMKNKFDANHIVQKTWKMIEAITTEGNTTTNAFERVVKQFNPKLLENTRGKRFQDEIKQIVTNANSIISRYPLIKHACDTYQPEKEVPNIIHYIKLMDADIKN